jgi:2-C-methyl-D-erythritol 4-phosphate cytidylyltransferase
MNVTIIPAAGRSKRMASRSSKQFLLLDGMPVLAHTLKAFEKSEAVDKIIVVGNAKDLDYCRGRIIKRYGFKKVSGLVQGGRRRQDSVFNGLKALPAEADVVLIHDGARPLVTPELVNRAVSELKGWSALVVGVPVKDTIKIASPDRFVMYTLDRPRLWLIQTPQVFKGRVLLEAHWQARSEGIWGTDDAMLVERLGVPVKVIEGSEENIKITTPVDMLMAEAILERRKK